MDFILCAAIFSLGFGYAPAVLVHWLERPKPSPAPDPDGGEPARLPLKCLHCAEPLNEHGQCPNVALSGIERYDRNRFYCGHAELRDLWEAGVA
jgi:hypothetical protein